MTSDGLLEDCQAWIEKGHQLWESYFSKWETMAKYDDEDLSEPDVIKISNNTGTKKLKNKNKTKKQPAQRSLKTKVLHKYKVQDRKKLMKKKKNSKVNKIVKKEEQVEECTDENQGAEDNQLEGILKAVFSDLLKTKNNKLQVLTVLSQSVPLESKKTELTNQSLSYRDVEVNIRSISINNQEAVHASPALNYKTVSPRISSSCSYRSVSSVNSSFSKSCNNLRGNYICLKESNERIWQSEMFENRSFNSFYENNISPVNQTDMGSLSRFRSQNNLNHFSRNLQSNNVYFQSQKRLWQSEFYKSQTFNGFYEINQTSKVNRSDLYGALTFPTNQRTGAVLNNSSWRSKFYNTHSMITPERDIHEERRRFGFFSLPKRTNFCVDEDDSNFITPQRKPLEQKCSTDIVSHRKRGRLSKKLLFDVELDDSDSDDQTQCTTPRIKSLNKKLKTEKPVDSDSDDCESIFDSRK